LHFENEQKTWIVNEEGLKENALNNIVYHQVHNAAFLLNIAKNYSFITNTDILVQNTINKKTKVNNGNYGKGIVTLNFNRKIVSQ
jgi:hypothetical protein